MSTVTFARPTGEHKEINVHFSVGYFLFGPLYLLFKGVILRGLVLALAYVVILWKGLFGNIKSLLVNWGVNETHLGFFDKLGEWYWYLMIGLAIAHVILTFVVPRIIVRKTLRNGFVPYCEIDTQILIKNRLAKVGTLCYLSSFKAIDGVQGKIKMGNSKDLGQELEELKQLLKDGMLTKDEYEAKRAEAIMRTPKKSKLRG